MTLNVWQSALLGALQGATEFLPVSSSGHLVLLREMLGVGEVPLLFDVLLHLSTLAAVGVVFRRRLADLCGAAADLLRPPRRRRAAYGAERRLLQLLVLTSLATGGVGMALQRLGLPREPRAAALMLLVTAATLIAARLLRGAALPRPGWQPRWHWALVVGVVQGVAVVPGISRSGATIAAGVLAGADRERAAEFSFLAAVPAILGALAVSLPEASALGGIVGAPAIAGGLLASFAVGWLALTLLLRIVRRGRLHLFALYLIPAGLLGLFVLRPA